MQISVAIVTYRRFNSLIKTLAALASQTLGVDNFTCIIVDNSLLPNESEAFKDRISAFPHISYIITDQAGISYARNTALENCKTRYIAFTDDDCIPQHDWLEQCLYAFENAPEHVACVGGKVSLLWEETPPPAFLTKQALYKLAWINYGDTAFIFSQFEIYFLATANAAYSCRLAMEAGGFPECFGVPGGLPHEETALNLALYMNGYTFLYEPTMEVQHCISSTRVSPERLISDSFVGGAGWALFGFESPTRQGSIELCSVIHSFVKEFCEKFSKFTLENNLDLFLAYAWNYGLQFGRYYFAKHIHLSESRLHSFENNRPLLKNPPVFSVYIKTNDDSFALSKTLESLFSTKDVSWYKSEMTISLQCVVLHTGKRHLHNTLIDSYRLLLRNGMLDAKWKNVVFSVIESTAMSFENKDLPMCTLLAGELVNFETYADSFITKLKEVPFQVDSSDLQWEKLNNLSYDLQVAFLNTHICPFIESSIFFDTEHYLAQIPGEKPQFPLHHYLLFGEKRGLTPCKFFSPPMYLFVHPELKEKNINALYHFVKYGCGSWLPATGMQKPSIKEA